MRAGKRFLGQLLNRNRISLGMIASLLLWQSPVQAFTTWNAGIPAFNAYVSAPVHDWITEVLKNNKWKFSENAYQKIIWAMAEQDIPASQAFLTAENHFDDNKISESLALVESRKKQINDLLPYVATDAAKREQFYTLFGQVLHALQDFYSHSNYVELSIRNNPNIRTLDDIKPINWISRPKGLRTGYFYWKSVTDWEKFSTLPTCISGLKSLPEFRNVPFRNPSDYCTFMECSTATTAASYLGGWVNDPKKYKSFNDAIMNATGNQAELHFYLNKDDWDTPMGSQIHPGSRKKLYEFARHLAEAETERQWQEIENKIKSTYGSDADKILLAIKTNTTQIISPGSGQATPTGAWKLTKTTLSPSESFQLQGPSLTTNARALITVPASTAHNNWNSVMSHALSVDSYKPDDASRTLKAPSQAGAYDIRVYQYQGAEDASLSFRVNTPAPTGSASDTPPQTQPGLQWKLSKTQLTADERYTVQYTPPQSGQVAYSIAILGTGAPHISYDQTGPFAAQRIPRLTFTNGASIALVAPSHAGAYHLRVYDQTTKNELATLSFNITPASTSGTGSNNNSGGSGNSTSTDTGTTSNPEPPSVNVHSSGSAGDGITGAVSTSDSNTTSGYNGNSVTTGYPGAGPGYGHAHPVSGGGLTLNKGELYPNEEITVQYTGIPDSEDSLEIAVVPATVSNENKSGYYLDSESVTPGSGSIKLDAPLQPGNYEVRSFDGDRELGRVAFKVQPDDYFLPPLNTGGLSLSKTNVLPSEEFTATYTGIPQSDELLEVQIAPPDVRAGEQNSHYLDGEQVYSGSGTVHLSAPNLPGNWEVRIYVSNQVLARVPIHVIPPQ